EQGREVFAVPGDVRYVQSAGTNRLIREGAKLVRGAEDILQGFPHSFSGEFSPSLCAQSAEKADEPDTARVMSCLSVERKDMEEISSETRLPASRAGALLSVLEWKGRIRRLPGNIFERV
ncbi:MAG: DNA-protecting protein DprA, partial [Armatimonadetes bacterium]|nr:DNA-protecting protein DprA [Armatimonadota bacterium]